MVWHVLFCFPIPFSLGTYTYLMELKNLLIIVIKNVRVWTHHTISHDPCIVCMRNTHIGIEWLEWLSVRYAHGTRTVRNIIIMWQLGVLKLRRNAQHTNSSIICKCKYASHPSQCRILISSAAVEHANMHAWIEQSRRSLKSIHSAVNTTHNIIT